MTKPLSGELSHCYSLMFTAEQEMRQGRLVKAALCFEECRKTAIRKFKDDTIFAYCLFRAARKEAQLLISLGASARAYRVLRQVDKLNINQGEYTDQLFILTQLVYLSSKREVNRLKYYVERLNLFGFEDIAE